MHSTFFPFEEIEYLAADRYKRMNSLSNIHKLALKSISEEVLGAGE